MTAIPGLCMHEGQENHKSRLIFFPYHVCLSESEEICIPNLRGGAVASSDHSSGKRGDNWKEEIGPVMRSDPGFWRVMASPEQFLSLALRSNRKLPMD